MQLENLLQEIGPIFTQLDIPLSTIRKVSIAAPIARACKLLQSRKFDRRGLRNVRKVANAGLDRVKLLRFRHFLEICRISLWLKLLSAPLWYS